MTYLWDVFVRISTLSSCDRHQFCAAIVDSSQDKGLTKAVDAMHNGAWVFPVTKPNIVSANSTCIAQNGQEVRDAHAGDFPQCKPIFQFSIHNNTKEGDALVAKPADKDPAIRWHLVSPIGEDDGDEVIFCCNVAGPL